MKRLQLLVRDKWKNANIQPSPKEALYNIYLLQHTYHKFQPSEMKTKFHNARILAKN